LLLESERKDSAARHKSSEEVLEEIRARHRDELKDLVVKVESAETERLFLEGELRKEIDRTQKELLVERDSLIHENISLQEQLKRATDRANRAETEVLTFKQERINDKEERNHIQHLMDRLEVHSAALENKQEETERERKCLESKRNEYGDLLKELRTQVRDPSMIRQRLLLSSSWNRLCFP
jgi:chromosome segregation ATPase